ncbi:MAG: hypothetical protein ACTSXL_00390 [Alphaproteobacteria bacterium]
MIKKQFAKKSELEVQKLHKVSQGIRQKVYFLASSSRLEVARIIKIILFVEVLNLQLTTRQHFSIIDCFLEKSKKKPKR